MPVRYGWWGYVKDMIRRYPELKEKDSNAKAMNTTAAYGVVARNGSAGRSAENAALSGLKGWERREFDAVRKAVAATRRKKNGAERLKLVELVFWKKTHTLEGAAQVCYVSYSTAVDWNREFIYLVAECFGMLD